jgi:hypothetical protein
VALRKMKDSIKNTGSHVFSDRIYKALKRVSRDKWISPDQMYEYGLKFALCKTSNMTDAINATLRSVQSKLEVQDAARCGMIQGLPPFADGESGMNEFCGYINGIKGNKHHTIKPLEVELRILKLKLKELKKWK